MNKAFIPISRDFFKREEYLAGKFDKGKAYFDLFVLAEFMDESKAMSVRGNPKTIRRGQIATSQLALKDRWKWDPKTVRKFLASKKREGLLDYESYPIKNPAMTIITLYEYDEITCQRFNKNLGTTPNFPSKFPTSNNITRLKNTTNEEDITITNENKAFDLDKFLLEGMA